MSCTAIVLKYSLVSKNVVCTSPSQDTFYYDDVDASGNLSVGDIIYTDSSCTNPTNNGWYIVASGNPNTVFVVSGGTPGQVATTESCSPETSPTPTPTPSPQCNCTYFDLIIGQQDIDDSDDDAVHLTYYDCVTGTFLDESVSTAGTYNSYNCNKDTLGMANLYIFIGGNQSAATNSNVFSNSICCDASFVSPTPTVTPSVTTTPSNTPSVTPSVTITPTPTITTTSSVTPSVTITPTPSQTSNATPSVTPSVTSSVTPTATPSQTSNVTPSVTPTVTPSVTITPTPSQTSNATPSVTPSITPSITPSVTTTPSITPSVTMTPTPSSTTGGPCVNGGACTSNSQCLSGCCATVYDYWAITMGGG